MLKFLKISAIIFSVGLLLQILGYVNLQVSHKYEVDLMETNIKTDENLSSFEKGKRLVEVKQREKQIFFQKNVIKILFIVTVWKRIGGSCFVIPGKYYGIIKPSDNYIITSNASDMDVVWEKDPSHVIVSMDEGSKIVNNSRNEITITDYKAKKKYNDSLYMSFDGTYLRHRKGTDFIILFIKENYAVDNYGNKMK